MPRKNEDRFHIETHSPPLYHRMLSFIGTFNFLKARKKYVDPEQQSIFDVIPGGKEDFPAFKAPGRGHTKDNPRLVETPIVDKLGRSSTRYKLPAEELSFKDYKNKQKEETRKKAGSQLSIFEEIERRLLEEKARIEKELEAHREKMAKEREAKKEKKQNIIKDALALSSGTISGLTGERNSEEIDKIQQDFVTHISDSEKQYKDWKSAWGDFFDASGLKEKKQKEEAEKDQEEKEVERNKPIRKDEGGKIVVPKDKIIIAAYLKQSTFMLKPGSTGSRKIEALGFTYPGHTKDGTSLHLSFRKDKYYSIAVDNMDQAKEISRKLHDIDGVPDFGPNDYDNDDIRDEIDAYLKEYDKMKSTKKAQKIPPGILQIGDGKIWDSGANYRVYYNDVSKFSDVKLGKKGKFYYDVNKSEFVAEYLSRSDTEQIKADAEEAVKKNNKTMEAERKKSEPLSFKKEENM